MENQFAILVADRNRNVREFLRREFEADGFCVHLAKDETDLMGFMNADAPPDLLVLDFDMPICGGPELLEKLLNRRPLLPVVIYTLLTEHSAHKAIEKAAAFLEKRGNNIDQLKTIVVGVLRKCYPGKFVGMGTECSGEIHD
ncbi:MAG TPA: response regulator [Desulfomonilaceae bacterium]|nr:response regulator [Desulfomonilaceae bacterium]